MFVVSVTCSQLQVQGDDCFTRMKMVTWGPPPVYSPEPFPESEEEGSLGLDELDESEEILLE